MIYAMNNTHFLRDTDPFVLFERMGVTDPSHAFYLGYELMKAKTALTLSKTYRQDQALDWGFLTEPEESATWHAAGSMPRSSRTARSRSRSRSRGHGSRQRPRRTSTRTRA